MPALVTSNFRISNAKQFINSFQSPEWGGPQYSRDVSYVYMFIGKPIKWEETHAGYSDINVPAPDGDVQGNEYEPWRDMIALDRVANTDISHGIKRINWTAGEVYSQYDDQDPSVAKGTTDFFVYNGDNPSVYKCLDNNGGVPSTVKPTIPSSQKHQPFYTSDGYRWKYMYQIPGSATGTGAFLSTNYVPTRTLNAYTDLATTAAAGGGIPEGWEDLAEVQRKANAGTLEAFVVVSGGSAFTAHSGGVPVAFRTVSANNDPDNVATPLGTDDPAGTGATYDWVQLTDDTNLASGSANNYDNAFFVAYDSSGVIYSSNIVFSNDGGSPSSAQLYFSEPIDVAFNLTGVNYHVGPKLELAGDGLGANIYSIMSSAGSAGISQVGVINSGNSYTTANVVTILPGTALGTPESVNIRPIISPPGGHGSDPISELNGWNVIVAKTFSGSLPTNNKNELEAPVSNTWPISNEYRTVGLVRNPILANGYSKATITTPGTDGANWFANSTPFHQTTFITVNGSYGSTWTPGTAPDEEVVGASSQARGRVVEYDGATGRVVLSNIVANDSAGTASSGDGSFLPWEQIGLSTNPTGKYFRANGYVELNSVQVAHDGTTTPLLKPDLVASTGDILYLEHRTPITRSVDQIEEVKLIIEF